MRFEHRNFGRIKKAKKLRLERPSTLISGVRVPSNVGLGSAILHHKFSQVFKCQKGELLDSIWVMSVTK